MKASRSPWVRFLLHFFGLLPSLLIVLNLYQGNLGFNPIQEIEQRLGRAALYLLMAALAITPLILLTGWFGMARFRRTLGLYSFLYVGAHFLTYTLVDYGMNFREIGYQILEKPFILFGFTAGILLVPLAVTSMDFMIRKMGRNWKILHRMVYPTSILVIIHYLLASKANLISLSGNILKPLIWGVVLIFLLTLRIPFIRKWINGIRTKIKTSV